VSARLRPLHNGESDSWYAAAKAGYAESIEHDGGVPHELAQRKAEQDLSRLLPDGRVPDDHAVFVIDRIALNVFGGNGPARDLYRSLGYREAAVFMEKEL
jgi:hypothetical protein